MTINIGCKIKNLSGREGEGEGKRERERERERDREREREKKANQSYRQSWGLRLRPVKGTRRGSFSTLADVYEENDLSWLLNH